MKGGQERKNNGVIIFVFCLLLFSFKSNTFSDPERDPAPNQFSLLLNETLSTGELKPEILYKYTQLAINSATKLLQS